MRIRNFFIKQRDCEVKKKERQRTFRQGFSRATFSYVHLLNFLVILSAKKKFKKMEWEMLEKVFLFAVRGCFGSTLELVITVQ